MKTPRPPRFGWVGALADGGPYARHVTVVGIHCHPRLRGMWLDKQYHATKLLVRLNHLLHVGSQVPCFFNMSNPPHSYLLHFYLNSVLLILL